MQLFIAEIIKEATVAGRAGYCELSFVLLRAGSIAEAEADAVTIGRAARRCYTNQAGECVEWNFVRVESVSPALSDKYESGSEIHAQVYKSLSAYEVAASQRRLEHNV